MSHFKGTKIICTIGPACANEETIVKMLKSGMNVARFNMSHGDHKSLKLFVDVVKKASRLCRRPVGLLFDTKGPEIRTLNETPIQLIPGTEVIIPFKTSGKKSTKKNTGATLGLSYQQLYQDVKTGAEILIADGSMRLEVMEVENKNIKTIVRDGGKVGLCKNVNVRDVEKNKSPKTLVN